MYPLPSIEFLMQKTETPHFGFVDLYPDKNCDFTIRSHVEPQKMLKLYLGRKIPSSIAGP